MSDYRTLWRRSVFDSARKELDRPRFVSEVLDIIRDPQATLESKAEFVGDLLVAHLEDRLTWAELGLIDPPSMTTRVLAKLLRELGENVVEEKGSS